MKAYFGRTYHISASHRLHTESLSPEANRTTFGKCNNPQGHGHNYKIQVIVGGPVDPATGMVLNLAVLDKIVHEQVVSRFDHMNLNLDPMFLDRVSTTENLCIAIFDLLWAAQQAGSFGTALLERLRIEETENNFFEYSISEAQAEPLGGS